MNQVQITLQGKQALVDADQVKLLLKKEALVAEALSLRDRANTLSAYDHMQESSKIATQIIRLNRRIRKTVKFI